MTFVCVRDFMLNYYAPTNTFKRVQLHRHAMRKFTETKIKGLGAKWGGTIVLLPTLAALWEPFTATNERWKGYHRCHYYHNFTVVIVGRQQCWESRSMSKRARERERELQAVSFWRRLSRLIVGGENERGSSWCPLWNKWSFCLKKKDKSCFPFH